MTRTKAILSFALLASALFALDGQAREIGTEQGKSAPCAVVDQSVGIVDLLDASRNHLYDTDEKREIPCGGWVSVDQGWVRFHHRKGYLISVGPNTLIQVNPSGDPIVVFKGQVFAQAGGGMGTLNVITPNSRGRLTEGSAILVYDADSETSQLIALEGQSTIENRFEPGKKMTLKPGQASSIDFSLLRVIPSVPRAVPASSLQARMNELKVSPRDQEKAIAQAIARRQENFVPAKVASNSNKARTDESAPYKEGDSDVKRDLASQSRKPASLEFVQDDRETAMLKQHMVDRLVAGDAEGAHILNPGSYDGPTQKTKLKVINVEDPAASLNRKAHEQEEAEKQRLIKELTTLKLE